MLRCSSVTFWQVSDAVPKTPGFTTTALAGATPASRKTGGEIPYGLLASLLFLLTLVSSRVIWISALCDPDLVELKLDPGFATLY